MTKTKLHTITRKEVPKIKTKRAFNLAEFIRLSAEVKKIIEKEKGEHGSDFSGDRFSFGE